MAYLQDTYTDPTGPPHAAVFLPWPEVTRILGHPHRGEPEDDAQLVAELIHQGAPDWVATAPGWIDEAGWGLIGPVTVDPSEEGA